MAKLDLAGLQFRGLCFVVPQPHPDRSNASDMPSCEDAEAISNDEDDVTRWDVPA